jgi:hypothetical protein
VGLRILANPTTLAPVTFLAQDREKRKRHAESQCPFNSTVSAAAVVAGEVGPHVGGLVGLPPGARTCALRPRGRETKAWRDRGASVKAAGVMRPDPTSGTRPRSYGPACLGSYAYRSASAWRERGEDVEFARLRSSPRSHHVLPRFLQTTTVERSTAASAIAHATVAPSRGRCLLHLGNPGHRANLSPGGMTT